MTTLLHRFPDANLFEQLVQQTELAYLFSSQEAMASLAEVTSGCRSDAVSGSAPTKATTADADTIAAKT